MEAQWVMQLYRESYTRECWLGLRALEIFSDSSAPTQRPLNGITCNSAYWLI